MDPYMTDVITGALLVGLITGAVPAICGAVKGNMNLGMIGFVCCLVSGLVLGLLLAIPICAVFVYKIFNGQSNRNNTANRYCSYCGNPVESNASFCSKCGRTLYRQ